MRLGRRTTMFVTEDSTVRMCISRSRKKTRRETVIVWIGKLYGNVPSVDERHRHRYEVNPAYVDQFESAGMKFVGRSEDNQRMEIIELEGNKKNCLNSFACFFSKDHPYFVGVQYHPEYISRPLKPSAPYLGLIWVNNLFNKLHLVKIFLCVLNRLLAVNWKMFFHMLQPNNHHYQQLLVFKSNPLKHSRMLISFVIH